MTEEMTKYLANAGAVLEIFDTAVAQLAQSEMALEVLTRTPNSSSNEELRNYKLQSQKGLEFYSANLNAARKAISELYDLTPDELRDHLLNVKTGVMKLAELEQQEKLLSRTFELLLESDILDDEENPDFDISEPSTWSRKRFEEALSLIRKQRDLNRSYISTKIQSPQSRILKLGEG
jgi:hypothetical protein